MRNSHLGGWILIILGSLFLLQKTGILPWNIVGYLWPLILIVAGVGVIQRRRN